MRFFLFPPLVVRFQMEILSIVSRTIFISWFGTFYLLFQFLWALVFVVDPHDARRVFICILVLRSLIGMCYIYICVCIASSKFLVLFLNYLEMFGIIRGLCNTGSRGNAIAPKKKKTTPKLFFLVFQMTTMLLFFRVSNRCSVLCSIKTTNTHVIFDNFHR